MSKPFRLTTTFLSKYTDRKPPFGFNGLGELVYIRTYSRIKEDGTNEVWWETVKRVVEGTYNLQRKHIKANNLHWNEAKAQLSAQEMYDRIWTMKFLPPGRGLWAMGSPITEERGMYAALQNCFAYETKVITRDGIEEIGDLSGSEQELLTLNGEWVKAPIRCFGTQELRKLTLKRQGIIKEIYVTAEHGWFAKSQSEVNHQKGFSRYSTDELKPGYRLQYVFGQSLDQYEPQDKPPRHWIVVSVEPTDRIEKVYCATVEGKGAFVLEGNILTANCAFVSTESIATDIEEPFTFLMDMSMLGVGVGFDTLGENKLTVKGFSAKTETVVITDDREGWVAATGKLLRNGLTHGPRPIFDYSLIRPAGLPIKGFGGVSSGPEPLIELHQRLEELMDSDTGEPFCVEAIVDVMNRIGTCVVAGNVRRTAEVVFGSPYDPQYLGLKDYSWNAETGQYEGERADRAGHGWTSNNSVNADLGMDYTECGERTGKNGEPGYIWLFNMQKFGRFLDRVGSKYEVFAYWLWKDKRAKGANPCVEQTLESYEMCTLVETFPANHDSLEDYKRTLKFAYLYAKTVTLGSTHWPKTNQVLLRNRRIGCSQSGIQQFIAKRGIEEYRKWCDEGYNTIQNYDRIYSEWLCIPRSIKSTSIKPSGTVSLLAGATPGMHWPEDLYYIRRVRLSKTSALIKPLKVAGYPIEPCVGDASSVVVEIPVALDDMEGKLRAVDKVSMWEQLSMAAFIQNWWANNQVSCTVTFDPEMEGHQIKHALNYFQYQLKGVSFLPKLAKGAYAQMPYESITKEKYEELAAKVRPVDFGGIMNEKAETEKFCDGATCTLEKA